MRVLGALLEKESTTPEYYPLSLNALVNACNQKSNRHPVVSYDDDTVSDAIDLLRNRGFAATITGGSRVSKFAQRFSEKLNLGRRELAVLTTLLLRGPQTVGELRDRSERMHDFVDIEEVEACLQRLGEHPAGPLVTKLPRFPGQKEARYAHLLGGPVETQETGNEAEPTSAGGGRLAALESEMARLRDEVRDLRDQFAAFRRQFE